MPTYLFEAIEATTGKEIRDTVDAATEAEAQATIRSMGYMVTKIKAKKAAAAGGKPALSSPRRWPSPWSSAFSSISPSTFPRDR